MSGTTDLEYRYELELLDNHTTSYPVPGHVFRLARDADCPYCGTTLDRISRDTRVFGGEPIVVESEICPGCQWWRKRWFPDKYNIGETLIGVLYRPDDSLSRDVSAVLSSEATTGSGLALDLSPQAFEQRVADILSATYGCEALHTGKSGDGGIDILLFDSETGAVAVQVKHRRTDGRAEGVAVVRELRGAMVLAGLDRGMLVTTAQRFSRAAIEAASASPAHLVTQEIELVDARRLLQILDLVKVAGQSNTSSGWWTDPLWPAIPPDDPPVRPLETINDAYLNTLRRQAYVDWSAGES